MATLAIRGHITRGIEVIETLQMLGGANTNLLSGAGRETIYYIKESNICCVCDRDLLPRPHIIFSLEIFLEKFPHKVGDKVISIVGETEVLSMEWISGTDKVWYTTSNGSYNAECLQPYKETMEERQYKELRMPLDDNDKLATEVTIDGNKIKPPKNHLIGKITKVNNGLLVEFVKKQPEYPKNYKECCNIVGGIASTRHLKYNTMPAYKFEEDLRDSLETLRKLIICRNAYWRIAGEEMGLGKPWESRETKDKYIIRRAGDTIVKGYNISSVLEFPTPEMRDAFYNNFKDLIEECKELL